MPEDHNDSLEQFFRKGLRGGEFAFMESDWEGLEKRLDDVDAAFRAGFRRGAGLISILLFIISALLVYTLVTGVQTEQIVGVARSSDNMISNEMNSPILAGKDSANKAGSEESKATEITQENLSANDAGKPVSGGTDLVEETDNESTSGSTSSSQKFNERVTTPSSSGKQGFDHSAGSVQAEDTMEGSSHTTTAAGPVVSGLHYMEPLPFYPFVFESDFNDPVGVNPETESAQLTVNHFASWVFGLGPELNVVDDSGLDRASVAVYLGYEAKVFRDLWFHSRLSYSRKYYKADGYSYEPPYYGFWSYGVVPELTYGNCSMLDLAVDLRYYLPVWPKSGLYLNTGVTSYVLFDESYEFIYETNDPSLRQSWSDNDTHFYPASNINIGIGYYTSISNKLDVMAEPFIKVPLSGVGYGDIPITTFGLYMGIRAKRTKAELVSN